MSKKKLDAFGIMDAFWCKESFFLIHTVSRLVFVWELVQGV